MGGAMGKAFPWWGGVGDDGEQAWGLGWKARGADRSL